MNKIPHFAGVQQLSLTDLQALADAVEAQTRILPPAGLPGRVGSRKYGLANFNLDTANSCDGSAWPENEGLIRSVGYSEEDEPYICQGDIALPMAHYVPGAGDETPAATGVLHSVLVEGGITAPDIQRGQMRLPLADSACDGAVAGLLRAVEVDEDASAPYISQGTLYLLPGGGGGGDDDCCGGCTCVLAQYNNTAAADVAGLIASVAADDAATGCSIVDGAITLPMADDTLDCDARAGLMKSTGQYSETLPTDGCDGWVQSLYLPMQSANGGAQIVSYRQLVRICNGQLQISAQRCLHPDGSWEVYFSL